MNTKWFVFVILVVNTIAVCIVFDYHFSDEFINWDDPKTIQLNERIQEPSNRHLKEIFTKKYWSHYQPITYFSFWLQSKTIGLKPIDCKRVNLVIHLFNSVILLTLLLALFKKKYLSFLVLPTVLIFLWHPIHVESIAWSAERKDVLYVFFSFLSMILFFKHLKSNKYLHFIQSLLLFVFALGAKSMAVAVPLLLFLSILFYKRKSVQIFIKLIPFFLVALGWGILSAHLNQAAEKLDQTSAFYSIGERLLHAAYGFCWYFKQFFTLEDRVPIHPFYDFPWHMKAREYSTPIGGFFVFVFAFIITTKPKILLWSLLWTLFSLLFTLQIVPFGRVLVADRYGYLAGVGIAVFFLQMLLDIGKHLQNYFSLSEGQKRKVVTTLVLFFMAYCIFYTNKTLSNWYSSQTYWSKVLNSYPKYEVAYNNLGHYYAQQQKFNQAKICFQKAIALKPMWYSPYLNLGNCELTQNNTLKAYEYFQQAYDIEPDQSSVHASLGLIYYKMGHTQKSKTHLKKALELDPTNQSAQQNLNILMRLEN